MNMCYSMMYLIRIHLSEGLNFLTQQQGHLSLMPSYCFVAAEAVSWVMSKMMGVHQTSQAVGFLQVNLLSHAGPLDWRL